MGQLICMPVSSGLRQYSTTTWVWNHHPDSSSNFLLLSANTPAVYALKQACLFLCVDQEGLTPLHVAAQKGHLHEITQLLAGVSKVQAQEMANATDQVSYCLCINSHWFGITFFFHNTSYIIQASSSGPGC